MCLLCSACHAKDIFADPFQMSHACQPLCTFYKTFTFRSLLGRSRIPCACHAKPHPNFKEWSETPVFNTLDFKMCFVHDAVHFLNISTSKSAPSLLCFTRFDFEICFVPQRCALFHMPTSKSASRMKCFSILTSKCASSLISPDGSAQAALASLLFDLPEPQNNGRKHSVS